jgi:hypothetical protein
MYVALWLTWQTVSTVWSRRRSKVRVGALSIPPGMSRRVSPFAFTTVATEPHASVRTIASIALDAQDLRLSVPINVSDVRAPVHVEFMIWLNGAPEDLLTQPPIIRSKFGKVRACDDDRG